METSCWATLYPDGGGGRTPPAWVAAAAFAAPRPARVPRAWSARGCDGRCRLSCSKCARLLMPESGEGGPSSGAALSRSRKESGPRLGSG